VTHGRDEEDGYEEAQEEEEEKEKVALDVAESARVC
jgi:hypothetical protein